METLIRDVRYALGAMGRAPVLTATVLLTFALGIGTTTAMFSVVHGMLLRPLPYAEPDRLVKIWEEHPGGATMGGLRRLSNRTAAAWTASPATLESLGAAYSYDTTVTFGPDGDPEKIPSAAVSPAVFGMVGAVPALGRFFLNEEGRPGAGNVVVLSDHLWRERYAASPDVVGRTLSVNGEPHTIVGVAQPSMEFPDRRVRLWVPHAIPAVAGTATQIFSAVGRLRADATTAQAEAEGTAAARSVPRPPSTNLIFGKGGPVVVRVRPLAEDMTSGVRPALLVLAAAVLLVLAIACANVANLLLSRGLARERELAIRAAVGASRARLLRQLLTESAVLSTSGGLLGLLLAWALVRVLPAIAPDRLPRLDDIRVDAVVLAFSIAASMVAGLAAGLVPALRAGRVALYDSIRVAGGSSAAGGDEARRLRHALLVAEAAFAVILVVGASLLVRSFVRLTNVDPGYRADHVLTAGTQMPREGTDEQAAQYIDAALARLRALPGVHAAGAGSMIPLAGLVAMSTFTIPEHVAAGKPTAPRALTYVVTPGYAEALSQRLKEGRFFAESDTRVSPRPLVVNEAFVRQYIGVQPVVGLQLGPLFQSEAGSQTEIIGVVADMLKHGNDRQPEPEIYFLHGTGTNRLSGYANFVVRTSGPPAAAANDVRAILRAIDRRVIVDRIDPLEALLAKSVARPRFGLTIVTAFAALALLLAAVGLYGVLSYGVSRRRRELAVRAALGADRGRLAALVVREGLGVTVAGMLAGIVAASLLTRMMETLLFNISPFDPVSYGGGLLVLIVVALAATLVPAWRASVTDPAAGLRE